MRTLSPTRVLPKLITLLVVTQSLFASTAHAAPAQAVFGLAPDHAAPGVPHDFSYYVFTAQPGQTLTSTIRITNVGHRAGIADLAPVDATTGQTSGTIYQSQAAPRIVVATWISFTPNQIHLNPGQSRLITFHVHVPTDAMPGQYVGAISAQNPKLATQSTSSNGSSIHINIRLVVADAIQINIPGPATHQFNIGGIHAGGYSGYQILYTHLTNTGNMLEKPGLALTITDTNNHTVQHHVTQLDTFLPHTTINYPTYITGHLLPPGTYNAHLTLTYDNHTTTYNHPFTITTRQAAQVFHGTQPLTSHTPQASKSLTYLLTGALAAAVLALMTLTAITLKRRTSV